MTTLTEPELIAAYTRRCDASIGTAAGDFGPLPVRCGQVVGIVRWCDASGNEHAACIWHIRGLERRYPPADPPMPTFLHEEPDYPDLLDFVDHSPDASYWTEGTSS